MILLGVAMTGSVLSDSDHQLFYVSFVILAQVKETGDTHLHGCPAQGREQSC